MWYTSDILFPLISWFFLFSRISFSFRIDMISRIVIFCGPHHLFGYYSPNRTQTIQVPTTQTHGFETVSKLKSRYGMTTPQSELARGCGIELFLHLPKNGTFGANSLKFGGNGTCPENEKTFGGEWKNTKQWVDMTTHNEQEYKDII